jgi:hypothetical protein
MIIYTHLKIFENYYISEIFSTLSLKIPFNLSSMCDILCVVQVAKHNIKIKTIDSNRIPKGFQTGTCGKRSLGKSLKQVSILFWSLTSVAGITQSRKTMMSHMLHFNEWRIENS